MTDSAKDVNNDVLLSDEATRIRWDWVHRAITLAKSSNAESLRAAEAGESPAGTPELVKG